MSGITLVSANSSLEKSLISHYGKSTPVRRVWFDQWRDPAEVAMDACAANPELLILGSDVPQDVTHGVVADVDLRYRATTTAVLVARANVEDTVALLRLGARDVLVEEPASDEFKAKIDPILELARDRHGRFADSGVGPRRRVITVVSPKGGTGKTTISTNLAVGLARKMPKQVLLLDLDLQFGDCAAALGLKPEHSLSHVLQSASLERSSLKVFLSSHNSGLAMLPPPDDLVAVDEIEDDDLKRSAAAMADEFPFVVIDTAAGIDAAALTAIELSTDLIFVTTTDVPAIVAVRRQIAILDQVGYTAQRRMLVLNRSNAKVGLSAKDVEETVGMEVKFEIPSTRVIPVSTNEGSPAIEKDTGNVAKRFEDLAAYFAPSEDQGSRSLLRAIRKDR
ncbi:MAG: AAA family ATPase [Acidimicrobiales bacterium]